MAFNSKLSEEEKKKRLKEANDLFVKQSYSRAVTKAKESKPKATKTTGASSGAPSSSQKTVIGPTQWNPNSTITTLPKAGDTMPKATNNVLPRAEDSMSGLERASRIGNIEVSDSIKNRGDNIVKGIGASLAASPMLLAEATKQSLGDWRNKVKTQGMEKALTDYAYNLDNPDYNFGSNPIDKNSKAYQNYAKSQEYYAKALEGLTPAQQKAGQTFISMLESASTLPTALINPSAPLLLMGAKSGANKVYELTNEGKSATEAAGRGILSGAIEALTEKIPLDDLLKAAKGGRSVVKNLLKQANVEGAEELTSYIMNYAADVSANDKNAHFSPKEAFENYAGGFVSGGIMGGAAAAIGNYMPTYEQTGRMPVANETDIAMPRAETPKQSQKRITASEYSDINNPVWKNVDIADSETKAKITKEVTERMITENKVVNISDSDISQFNEYYPDLRGMKKSERTPILKEKMKLLKIYFKRFLSDNFKGKSFNLNLNGNILEATFDQVTINEVLEKITPEKSAMLNKTKELLNKAEYLYSTQDKKGSDNVYRWNYFYVPIDINGEMAGVRIAVKDSKNAKKSQIYNYGIKKEATSTFNGLRGSETPTISDKPNVASNIIIPESNGKINTNLGIVNPDVQELFEATNQIREEGKQIKQKFRNLHQSVVSGLSPLERMSKADTRDNRRNIYALANKYGQKNGIVDTILRKGMYDINGNKIDDRSWVDVASQVPASLKADFDTYLQELHNVDRQAQGKPVTEHTADESRQIAADLEAKYPQFKQYAEDIYEYSDKVMRAYLVGGGMMSEEAYNYMRKMYPHYIPTFRVGYEYSGVNSVRAGKKIKNVTGIGTAKGSTLEVMSFDEAFAKKISNVVSAAVKNDISREIFSFAQAMPEVAAGNGILIDVQVKNTDINTDIDDIEENKLIRKINDGNYDVTFFNNGTPVTMRISRDVYEALTFLDNKFSYNRAMQTLAGLGRAFTAPMKALTTQYNPLFALTNIMRDAQSYAINNTASNSIVAMKNYVKAIKEIAKRSDIYEQYKAMGGSQNGYYGENMYQYAYNEARPGNTKITPKSVLTAIPNAIEKVGNFTEMIPRLAEYMNTIDRYGNTDAGRLQASLNAADVTVNFNRSSTLSTLANAWVPYFNAGLQGMDKTLRQIKAHPVQTTARATVSVFLPTLLLYMVNKDNPYWEDVKDGVRDNYYLIPNYAGPVTNGYAETFIRIPKSREFGALFSASFERFMRALNSEEDNTIEAMPDAFDGYLDTLLNSFMPNSVLDDNIFGAMKRLGTNTAWHGGKIVPSNLVNVSPQNQYDINTSGIAMNAAKTAERFAFAPDWAKSPMKVDYMIDSYGGYMGDLLQGLTSRKNIGADTMETVKNSLYNGFIQPVKNRFSTDSAYSNYNLDRFYDRTDELEIAANDRNIEDNLPTDYVTPEEKIKSDFTKASGSITDLTKQERAILESAMPIQEKNAQIRELKKQKNDIAKDMLTNEKSLFEEYARNYVPQISKLSDERQATAKELVSEYGSRGFGYDDYMNIYEKYAELNKEDLTAREKATELEEFLAEEGYPRGVDITNDLRNEFRFYSMAPADSYYDSKNYQMVQSFMPVDVYADLSSTLSKMESGVDYPKGERSPYYKSAIDQYLAEYGYNPTYNQRMKIYESMGVAKKYRY